jgi:cytochrome b561
MRWFGLVAWPRIGSIASLPPDVKEQWHTTLGMVHTGAGYLLYALVALHVAAALKHQWFDREPELQRMGVGRG